jgi:hypothetical protein
MRDLYLQVKMALEWVPNERDPPRKDKQKFDDNHSALLDTTANFLKRSGMQEKGDIWTHQQSLRSTGKGLVLLRGVYDEKWVDNPKH